MSDSTQHAGGQDRTRINVHQDHELRDWSQRFGVSADALRDAVRAVGTSAEAVQAHLKQQAGRQAALAADTTASHVEPSTHSTKEVDQKLRGVEDRVSREPGAGSPAVKPNRDLDPRGAPVPDVLDLRGG